MTPSRPGVRAAFALLAITFVWGATFPLVKAALADCTPLLFNLLRMALATAVLVSLQYRQLRSLSQRQLASGALAGILLALGYEFQTAGLRRTTSVRSAFLTGLVVVIVPLLAAIPGIRRTDSPPLRVGTLAGAALALAGLVLLSEHGTLQGGLFRGPGVGEWLTIACAFAFAGHLLTLDRAGQLLSAGALGVLQITFCALTMLLLLPLEPHASVHFSSRVVLALAVTSLLATAAAFTIQSWAQQHLAPAPTALLLSLEPVFALLISWGVLGKSLTRRELAGAGLILTSILFTELQPRLAAPALARKDI